MNCRQYDLLRTILPSNLRDPIEANLHLTEILIIIEKQLKISGTFRNYLDSHLLKKYQNEDLIKVMLLQNQN